MAKQKNNKQLELIQTLLNDAYLQKNDDAKFLQEKENVKSKILEEDKPKAKIMMQREIKTHEGLEYLLYKFDEGKKELFPFFFSKSGNKRICDYFLFVEEKELLYVFVIELKLGATVAATNQLEAAECFAEFIVKSAQRLNAGFSSNFIIRKIRICEERGKQAQKRLTKVKPLVEFNENGIINYDHFKGFMIKYVLDV